MSGQIDVQNYGATGDARHVDDAAMTASSATLTSATAAFSMADVGKTVSVNGAGASGGPLITTISGVTNSTTATLAASASATVSGQRAIIGTLDTAAINSAMAAATRNAVYFPSGGYLIHATATGHGAVTIPSYVRLLGDGAIIYVVGSDGQSGGNTDDAAVFYIDNNSSDITIRGLRFIGENYPFTYVQNNALNPILIANARDVTVQECQFEDMYGFAIHNWAAVAPNGRVNAQHNVLINCANGINVNSDYSDQSLNVIYNSEGLESSGAYTHLHHNIIISALASGISAGGRTSPGDLAPGPIIDHNTIVGVSEGSAIGIVLADGCINGMVDNNYIERTSGPGIEIVTGGFNPITGNTVQGNTIISCGATTGGYTPIGIFVTSGADNTRVLDNDVRDTGIDDYSMAYAFAAQAVTGLIIRNNRFLGTNYAASIYGATDVKMSGNEFFPGGNGTFDFFTPPTFAEVGEYFEASPSISSNQNDYDPILNRVLRFTTDASRNLTGIKGGWKGRLLTIINVGSNNLVLKNQDTNSSAANRIITGTGSDLTLAADATATLFYDSSTQRWRVL